jgi:hypothetical protein
MTEKELIKQLKTLKEIKPRKEWALLLKSEILNAEYAEQKITAKPATKAWSILELFPLFNYQRKLAYAFATLCFFVVGVFGFAQYTMPGDLLFPVKKITEQTQTPLQVAYNRSEDLVQIIKENKTQNLDSAILEFKASVTDAAKTITQNLVKNSDKESIKVVMAEVKKIQDNQEQMKTLGVNIGGTNELDNVLALLVQEQIDSLNESTLTEKQEEVLKEITELYEQGKYSDALEQILLISN